MHLAILQGVSTVQYTNGFLRIAYGYFDSKGKIKFKKKPPLLMISLHFTYDDIEHIFLRKNAAAESR